MNSAAAIAGRSLQFSLYRFCPRVFVTPQTYTKPGSKFLRQNGTNTQTQKRFFGSIYEPDYLDSTERTIPKYDLLNVQIKGYDFPVLEAYGKFIHNTAERVGIDVEDSWATPCKKLKINRLFPESTHIESEYQLNVYERNVQISEVPTTILPLFINMVEAALPAGVTLRVQPHEQYHMEVRYVPDLELKELREKLDTMTYVKKDEGPRRR